MSQHLKRVRGVFSRIHKTYEVRRRDIGLEEDQINDDIAQIRHESYLRTGINQFTSLSEQIAGKQLSEAWRRHLSIIESHSSQMPVRDTVNSIIRGATLTTMSPLVAYTIAETNMSSDIIPNLAGFVISSVGLFSLYLAAKRMLRTNHIMNNLNREANNEYGVS